MESNAFVTRVGACFEIESEMAWSEKLTNVGVAPGLFLTRPKAALGSRAQA